MKKVKDQAIAVKLDTDVSQGRAGGAMGEHLGPSKQPGPNQFQTGGETWGAELNAFNGKGPKGGGEE